jgi:TrmH family RNA methyltransferase
MKITSRDNSLLRRARAVRDGKASESIFIEGLRLCEEALRSGVAIEAVIYSEQLARKGRASDLIHQLQSVAVKAAAVSEKMLESISYTKTPQGVVVLAPRPAIQAEEFSKLQGDNPLVVILHRLNNPVNVGAILRTAEAAGVTGAITTLGTADPFSPKALRGAMGASFRLPTRYAVDYRNAIEWSRDHKLQIASTDLHATRSFTEIDFSLPTAIVMGSESEGLSAEEIALSDIAVKIPMKGSTESLNVAVAAGILLYEAARQR